MGDDGEGDDHASEDFTQGPLQNLLTQLAQRTKKTPRRSSATPATKKTTPSWSPIPPKPWKLLSGWYDPAFADSPLMGEAATEKVASVLKRLRRNAANAKARGCKKKKSEAETLKRPAGWLDFDKKLQRRLDGGDY